MESSLTITNNNALTTSGTPKLTRDQIELIKRTCAKDATDDELQMFIAFCNSKGTNPLAKEIYFSKFGEQVNFFTSYHFMLAKVQESGLYEGMTTALFCGENGEWKEIWLEKAPPKACKVGVYRKGYREAVYSIRYFEEAKSSSPKSQWPKQPVQMLKKTTIADALRLAFDDILRGMYIADEMPLAIDVSTSVVEAKPTNQLVYELDSVIPSKYLPKDLQDKNLTFESLARDYNPEHTYISPETNAPVQIRHILHKWATSKYFEGDVIQGIAKELLNIYPSK
jgi:phage recombination protein Bet